MIFVIPGADYSANNIGQVETPIIYDEATTLYLNAIPTAAAGLTYDQRKALNNFIKGLKTASIFTKITHLCMPVFGMTEGGVNIVAPSTNINLPSTNATYDSDGVLFSLGWDSGISKNGRELCCGFYNTTAAPIGGSVQRIGISRGAGGYWLARKSSTTSSTASDIILSTDNRINFPNHAASIGPIICSYSGSGNYMYGVVDAEFGSDTAINQTPIPTSFNVIIGGAVAALDTSVLGARIGLITLGAPLTDTEIVAYGSLQTSLMSAF